MIPMTGKHAAILVELLLLYALSSAQSTMRPKYMDRALIQHGASGETVTANDPLPLHQAISALSQEYGWRVNWEVAPCYSRFDVVDDTGPKWRSSHPGEKGVTRPAGGLFVATFPDPASVPQPPEEEILNRVIEAYNATDNPGKYALRTDARGLLTVVGTTVRDQTGALQKITPVLDTPLTIEKVRRNAYDTINLILDGLSVATNRKLIIMSVPTNLLRDTLVEIGGRGVAARALLRETLDGTQRPLQYDLGFDPDFSSVFILNITLATRTEVDGSGRIRPVPIDHIGRVSHP